MRIVKRAGALLPDEEDDGREVVRVGDVVYPPLAPQSETVKSIVVEANDHPYVMLDTGIRKWIIAVGEDVACWVPDPVPPAEG